MPGTLTQRRDVAQKLRVFSEEVEWIKTRVESLLTLSTDDKEEVTERFGKLKDTLESEYHELDLVRNQESLNPAEAAFYLPAAQKAYIALTDIRRGTLPSLKWSNALYLARFELQHFLSDMETESESR